MKAKCVHNTGAALGQPVRGNFYTTQTEFQITIGTTYYALGLGMFETLLAALVCDDTGKPNWLPVGLFEIPDGNMQGWAFNLLDGKAGSGGDASNRWVALWGYPELVRDPSHSDALIERDPEALEVFYRELTQQSGG